MPSTLTNSPRSGFTPRKEFVREQQTAPNSFCLLAVSGQNCIRLYSFPDSTVAVLRKFFNHFKVLTSFREDIAANFCEFTLEGKPWSSPKNVATERLLVEILSLVIQSGYSYLSTIDYGREHDDRLAIAFSRPVSPPSSRPDSPPSDGTISLPGGQARLPFALSFPSSSLLRVIAPPLDSTPAILQAVRGAWPRGVVSEKKVGDNVYEFKLKGYSWFQEDTFATDSLRHILTLLSRLDAHSFSLLTSLSLTNRSRVKDLWIFLGPPTGEGRFSFSDSPPQSVLGSAPEFRRAPQTSEPLSPSPGPSHQRNASDPPPLHPAVAAHHHRATTSVDLNRRPSPENNHLAGGPSSRPPIDRSTLRKPAPRAQIPVSVHEDGPDTPRTPGAELGSRLPSHISEGLENMTGIGAGPYGHGHTAVDEPRTPDVFYAVSPFAAGRSSPGPGGPQSSPRPQRPPPAVQIIPALGHDEDEGGLEEPRERWRVQPPAEVELESPHPTYKIIALNPDASPSASEPGTPDTPKEIMGENVFRDSALSTTDTEISTEVPIKWTGTMSNQAEAPEPSPVLPGGWAQTPAEEKPEPPSYGREDSNREIHDVRVAMPEVVQYERAKSEAGMIGMMATPSPEKEQVPEMPTSVAPPPTTTASAGVASPTELQSPGWVMVNVEGQSLGQSTSSQVHVDPRQSAFSAADGHLTPSSDTSSSTGKVDATGKPKPHSRIKRLFSLTRKDSKRGLPASFSDVAQATSKTRSPMGKLSRP